MAKPREPLEVLDDDLGPPVNGPPEGMPSEASTEAQEGPLNPAGLFPGGPSPVDRDDWRMRRDAWDHRTYNPEFHLGVDRKNADGTFRARRAPEQGTGAGAAASGANRIKAGPARPLPVSTVEAFLVSSHLLISGMLSAPELKLDKDDANNLAVPITKVAALHDLKVDPRTEAYGMLMLAMVAVYGPKFAAWFERLKAERARNVTPRPPQRTGPPMQPPPGAPAGTFGPVLATVEPTPIVPGEAQKEEGKGAPPMTADAINKLFGD